MAFLKKYYKFILLILSLIVLFFITRLYNISSLPLFTDEAIYTRWSQIARYDAAWRFISLTDGKQPSFVWFDMTFMRFIKDPLLSGRLVSVFAGFFGMIGMFFLASETFKNRKIGIIASTLFVIYPFSLVYDRMALYDSLVAASMIWALFFEILLIRLKRLDIALILGMIMGFGVLTKTSAFFAIYLLPFSLVLFNFKAKKKLLSFLKWVSLALISVIMAYAFYSILRLSPFFHIISDKDSIFVYPINEWIKSPFSFFVGNFNGLTDWFISYVTIPLFLLIFSSFFIESKFLKEKLLLLAWFILPFTALAFFGKVLYPRFILFMTMPLIVLASYSLNSFMEKAKKDYLKVGIFLAFIILLLRSDFYIMTDFARAPIAKADLNQYINAWPAGGGIKEMVVYFGKQAKTQKIYVATEGTFGSLPTYAMEIYLDENRNIGKRGIWPLPVEIPKDLADKAKKMKVYFVLYQTKLPPPSWPLKLISSYQKGIGDSYLKIYEVIPSN